MKHILTTLALLFTLSLSAQTPVFTFECFSNANMTGDSCDICTGTSFQSRSFNGLMVYRLGVFNKWIDEPYLIRLRPGNSVEFIEQSGSTPDKITIPLSQTQFTTVAGFIDSTFCAGANIDFSFFASDSLRTTEINYLDTLSIVGRGGTTVFFDTLTQKYIITSGSGGAGTDLSFSGTSSPVTLNSSTGSGVTITAGAGNSLSATGTNITITATDQSATNEAQSLTSGTNTVTLSAVSGVGGGTVTVDTNPSDDVTGSGVDGRVALWNGTQTQTSDDRLLFNRTTNRLSVGTVLTNGRINIEMTEGGIPDTTLYFTSASGNGVRWMGCYNYDIGGGSFNRGFHYGSGVFGNVLNVELYRKGGVAIRKPFADGIDYSFEVASGGDDDGIVVSRSGAETQNAMFHVNSEGDGLLRTRSGNWTLGDMDITAAAQNPTATLHLFKPSGIAEDDIFATEKSSGYGRTIMSQFFTGSSEYGTSWRNGAGGRYMTMMTVSGTQRVGINTYTPAQTFHVNGVARITGSGSTGISITGRDINGDITNIGVGSGLSFSLGSLSVSASGLSKWSLSGSDIYNTALGNVAVGTTGTTVSKFRVSGNSASTCARLDAGTLDAFGSNLLLSGSSTSSIFAINSRHSANGNVLHEFTNQYNTSTSAHSIVQVNSGGSGGGDPLLQLKVQGESDNVVIGVDNDELNKFRISRSDALSTGNESGLTILTDSKTGVNEIDPPYMLAVNGTDGIGFPSGTTLERPAISMPVIRFNNNIGGFEAGATNNAWYRISSTQTPTVTWNSGIIGTGGSVTFTSGSNDVCGTLVITTGATPTGTNVSAITIVFTTPYNTVTPFGMIAARNAITATEWNKFHIGTTNTLQMAIGVAAALAPSTEYRINYRIQQ